VKRRRVRGRVELLAGALALVAGCNQRFYFDQDRGAAGQTASGGDVSASAGRGGAASGGEATSGGLGGGSLAGTSATSGTAGDTALGGGAGASDATAPCGAIAECPDGLHCADDRCVECASDADCGSRAGPRCEPLRHRCVDCLTSQDCAAGSACDSLANHCLPICYADRDCPRGAHGCDERRQVCYQCDEDFECATSPLGSLCATDGSGCVQCRKDVDCKTGHCDQLNGRCVECRDGLDCTSGLCSPTTFSCISD